MRLKSNPTHLAWLWVALAGCATYRPEPLEPAEVLEQLDAIEWRLVADSAAEGPVSLAASDAAGPRELAAFAVRHNPQLAAVRAELGLRRALLVEAGLLPDPELSWDAMDVLASEIVRGTSSSLEVLAGLGLMLPLPRPGERDARIGAAEWRLEEAKRHVLALEWSLTRDIHLAYEDVRSAETLLMQTQALAELAQSTHDYFERAKQAGTATAIQANLALGDLQAMRLDGIRAESRVRQARQTLNALLGLAPSAVIRLRDGEDPSLHKALANDVATLTAHAVELRPDLVARLAGYQAAEEDLRLATSKRFPLFAVGTGIRLTLPLFSKFGGPEIQTALEQRARLRSEFTAAVHSVREEVAAAHTLWELAKREVELVETQLLPNAEETLALSQEAFQAGEVTLLETLALQHALVEARTQRTVTRAERAKRAWALLAVSGALLERETTSETNPQETSQ